MDNDDGNGRGEGSRIKDTRGKGLRNTRVISRGEGLTHEIDSGESEDLNRNKDDLERNVQCSKRRPIFPTVEKTQGKSREVEARGIRKRKHGPTNHTLRTWQRRSRFSASSESTDDTPPRQLKRRLWNRRTESSSESRDGHAPPKRVRMSRSRREETDRDLMNKFLTILDKVKGSDKPKMAFDANVIPEFDPLSKEQTILSWLTKIEECAEIYGWEEKEIIHYSLPKLSGVAKTWYQGLTSILHTWTEWKRKLIESFPCREDYAELLTEMLSKKVKYGESLEQYYYAKINLLNRCKINGKQAVDCLLYGVEDRAVKVGAQAAQFNEPEQVLKYFRTVKSGQSRDIQDFTRKCDRKFESNLNHPEPFISGRSMNSSIRCYNCDEIGHPSFKCDKPLIKCSVCERIGHLAANCFKNKKAPNEPEHNKIPETKTGI